MSRRWLIHIEAAVWPSLIRWRTHPALEAAQIGESYWVAHQEWSEKVPKILLQIPNDGVFYLDDRRRLFPMEGITPVGTMPNLNWQSLQALFPIDVPTASLPGQGIQPVTLQLIADTACPAPNALLIEEDHWDTFLQTAPAFKLAKWEYARSNTKQILVLGAPLPPLPGTSYHRSGQLLIPTGWRFQTPDLAGLFEAQAVPMGLGLALVHPDGNWEHISLMDILPVSRSLNPKP
ncbi:hypothetical protein [Pontibacter sp. G13]|uniref:hypothetical protein n=1 Tax=Pontibacter sp. G13 TaxID=3074898 RepID=UPI00288B1AB9|nr:hypothetical protein [Pontibacter sp. G13]WNJ19288.1 hypothetical protein RJD25_02250 [Pontibacter sp. G13]